MDVNKSSSITIHLTLEEKTLLEKASTLLDEIGTKLYRADESDLGSTVGELSYGITDFIEDYC